MDLSIIIVSYNVKQLLLECLNSIAANTDSLQVEIIVVDNASSDGTVPAVREFFPGVRMIENTQNVGFPHANNQALGMASGNAILLLNPDTLVHTGALTTLVGFLRDRPRPVIVGLNVRNQDGTWQHSVHPMPTMREFVFLTIGLSDLFPWHPYFNYDLCMAKEPVCAGQVGWVSGAALAFDRDVLHVLKGLDADLFWAEDLDFCYRAAQAGIPVYFLPDARITHYVGKSGEKNIERMVFHQVVSKIRFSRKHYGKIPSVIMEIIVFVQLCLKIGIRTAQCIYSPRRRVFGQRISAYVGVLRFILGIPCTAGRLD